MAAPRGNKFWEARSSHGRKPKFETDEALWSACCEYFEWVENNPLWEIRTFAYQGAVTQEHVPKMRAMTLVGLCLFLDISDEAWRGFRNRNDLVGITQIVEKIIYEQKFTGAAADLFNANIIARDLGLADKRDVRGTLTDLTDEELDRKLAELRGDGKSEQSAEN